MKLDRAIFHRFFYAVESESGRVSVHEQPYYPVVSVLKNWPRLSTKRKTAKSAMNLFPD